VQTVEASPIRPVPTAPPAPAPAARPAAAPTTAVASAAPIRPAVPAAAPATPAVAAVAPKPVPAAAPAAGGALVQIGAYSSTALADRGFSEVSAAFPGQMSGKSTRVETLARDGKTLYRGLIGGFANRGAAQAFCETLKASGRVCLVRG